LPTGFRYANWLSNLANSPEPFALSERVLEGFLRMVSNRRIFQPISSTQDAFRFIDALLQLPNCILVRPGPQHGSIFRELRQRERVHGSRIADAAHAALAIETGCEWVTADTDFARFAPPLRWRHL
jgi:uncharacterized protein